MDSRATFGVDMALFIKAVSWPLLKSLCSIHVLRAYPKHGREITCTEASGHELYILPFQTQPNQCKNFRLFGFLVWLL